MDIYDRILDLLRKSNKTKMDLARGTQIPYTTIASIFSRRSEDVMKIRTATAIAAYLGVSIDFLVFGIEASRKEDGDETEPDFSNMDYTLIRIARKLSMKNKATLLAYAFELEEKEKVRTK